MADVEENIEDGVALLSLNRPGRLNAVSPEAVSTLLTSVERLGKDPEVGAILLTGVGRAFCSGGDVKAMGENVDRDFEARLADLEHVHRLPQLIHSVPKPTIALVNGPAIGAGLCLALACDFRIAATSASLCTGFAKVGLSGDYGGTWFLTQLVGPARARRLYFLAPTLMAEEALAEGLVDEVVEDEALMRTGRSMALSIAERPRLALSYMKRNLVAAQSADLKALMKIEALHQARTGLTEEHRLATRTFSKKRSDAGC